MASQNEQLFLDRFVAYNKERYADNPSFVAKLDALQIENVQFSNFQKVDDGEGQEVFLVDLVSPRFFRATGQTYEPADYMSDKASSVAEEDALPLEALRERATPGIYRLVDGEEVVGAVLVHNGEKTTEMVIRLVQEGALFEIDDVGITVDAEIASVDIESHTIVGRLVVVVGLFDQWPRYNGQYRMDGSVSAL